MTFGEHLRTLRLTHNLVQRELAERLGVSFTYLSKIENDRMEHPPSEELIYKLAEELGENPDTLLLLAKRIPSDVAETILENPESVEFLRSSQNLTREEWQTLIREIKRKKEV